MIKHSKAVLSLVLTLTLLMSILTPMSASAEEKPTYDYEKGHKLATYAARCIQNALVTSWKQKRLKVCLSI